jgi:hypothetical protein
MRFIGRGRSLRNPVAIHGDGKLSNSEGAVLDPITAIQITITVEPEQTVMVDLIFGIAQTPEEAISLAGKYHDKHFADASLPLHGPTARLFSTSSASRNLMPSCSDGLPVHFFTQTHAAGKTGFTGKKPAKSIRPWGYGISGDLPIVLLRIGDELKIEL